MVVMDPELHDGLMLSIELTQPGCLTLRCLTGDRQVVTVVGHGLVNLLANEFREGNVIFEVRLSGADEPTDDALARLYSSHPGGIEKGRRVLCAGGRILEIDSSYGCALIALCSGTVVFLNGRADR